MASPGTILYLRSKGTKQMHFLRRLIIRNHNNSAIPSRAPDHGETDSSVTGGSLNDRCAWFQSPRSFRVSDNSVGGAIFHRSGRVHEFRLSQNLTTCDFGQVSQSNQRRVPNVSVNARVCRTHDPLNPLSKLLSHVSLFDSRFLQPSAFTTLPRGGQSNWRREEQSPVRLGPLPAPTGTCTDCCASRDQIPNADKTAEYLVTNAVSSGCDASKFSTDCFSSCKSFLVCSGFF